MDEKDPRLIVTLEADGTTAERAWNRPQNQDRCLPASESVVDISSRESTPAVEQPASQIQLTFNDKPKDLEKGFVFGSDPQICDVFLGERGAGFSGRQFCITFNERGDVIFKNTSRKKAHVDYNGESPQFRNQFTWILFDTYKDIIITLGEKDKLIFKVKWPKYRDSHRAEYEAYREAYFQERRNALPPLSQLGMESQQTTVVPTAQQSPRQGSPRPKPSGQQTIYLSEEELGRGGFGTVYKAVDVSTGDVYAAKKFDHGNWKKEVDILMRLSHVSVNIEQMINMCLTFAKERIVKFVNFSEEQKPLLVMEYLPLGNLVCQDFITEEETLQVLYQGLEALEYLHSYSPSLAHRDIKPANILVQSRMPFAIKLADFGFAKNDSSLKTFCGSNEYAAPEIWGCHHYTAMVDIWSLGVVVLEYAYGLPQPTRERKGKPWCRDIVKAAEDGEDGDTLIDLISTKMLRMNYQDRLSASDCLEQVYRLGFHRVQTCDTGLATPTGKSTRDLQDGTHFYSKSTLSKRQRQQTVQSASDDAGGRGPSKRSRASVSFEAGEAMPAVTDFNERYVQITIDDKTVLMRKGDCLLNATQILTFANTNRNDRASILKIMKEQTVLEKVSPAVGILWRHSWVNFQHGRILCKHLKLEQELKSLIDYGLEAQYDDRSKTAEPVHDYITEVCRRPPFEN